MWWLSWGGMWLNWLEVWSFGGDASGRKCVFNYRKPVTGSKQSEGGKLEHFNGIYRIGCGGVGGGVLGDALLVQLDAEVLKLQLQHPQIPRSSSHAKNRGNTHHKICGSRPPNLFNQKTLKILIEVVCSICFEF